MMRKPASPPSLAILPAKRATLSTIRLALRLCCAAMIVTPLCAQEAAVPAIGAGNIAALPELNQIISLPVDRESLTPLSGALAGVYVTGQLTITSGQIEAWFADSRGEPLRSIPVNPHGTSRFHAISPEGGLQLLLKGKGTAELRPEYRDAADPAPIDAVPLISPRLHALISAPDRDKALHDFSHEIAASGTPLIEGEGDQRIVTFLWEGPAQNVRLFGGPGYEHLPFTKLEGTHLWYLSLELPADSRFSYRIAPDIPTVTTSERGQRIAILATAATDPLNMHPWPETAADRWQQASTVSLPEAPAEPGWPLTAPMPQLEQFSFTTHPGSAPREITLSLPPTADLQAEDLVLALIFDGEAALSEMETPRALAGLQAEGKLPPIVGVYIPSIDSASRAAELPGNAAFTDGLIEALIPEIERRLQINIPPERRVAIGASYGGLAASRMVAHPSRAIGAAIALSPSYWWRENEDKARIPPFARDTAEAGDAPLRMVIAAGRFERGGRPGVAIYDDAQLVSELLNLKGHKVHWQPYTGGHDWFAWRSELTRGLITLFGPQP